MKSLGRGMETLESRQMMAGDVAVSVTGGGDLIVRGDNSANEVVVRATENSDAFLIEGLNGTKINGQASVEVSGVTDDMRIDMRGGDNQLLLTSESETGTRRDFDVPDDLQIRSGNEADAIVLDDIRVGDDSRIDTRNGDDAVIMYATDFGDRLTVRTGNNQDVVAMDTNTVGGRVDIRLGGGNDTFMDFGSQFDGRVDIRMDSGNDLAAFADSEFNDSVRTDGGSGVDGLVANDAIFDEATAANRRFEAVVARDNGDIADLLENHTDNHDAFLAGLELIFVEGSVSF